MKPRNRAEWGVAVSAFVAFFFACLDFVLGSWAIGIAMLSLAGVQWVGIFTKRWAYYTGWVDGRSNLALSMAEAQRRNMSPGDFMVSVMEKDASLILDRMGKRQYRKFRERVEAADL